MNDTGENPTYVPSGLFPNDKPKRRFGQIHLSTAIVMMLVAGLMLPMVVPYFKTDPFDVQGQAADAEWNLANTVKDFASSVSQNNSGYAVTVVKKPNGFFLESDMIVSDSQGKELCKLSVEGGSETPFLIKNDVIYYANYCPITSGCGLSAFDLKTAKQHWNSGLQGIGGTDHSKYSNHVNLKKQAGAIVVYGNESHGKYIEFVDMKSGNTVGHRAFDLLSHFPRPSASDSIIPIAFIVVIVFASAFVCEYFIRRREARRQ